VEPDNEPTRQSEALEGQKTSREEPGIPPFACGWRDEKAVSTGGALKRVRSLREDEPLVDSGGESEGRNASRVTERNTAEEPENRIPGTTHAEIL